MTVDRGAIAQTRRAGGRAVWLHPVAVLLLPLPAMAAALAADGVAVGLTATLVGVLAAARRGWRYALGTLAMALGATALLWLGFVISLPREAGAVVAWLPGDLPIATALDALRGALRIVAIMVLLVGVAAWVRWDVLADSLTENWRVPYRLVDITSLGERFAVLIRGDMVTARNLARLRARGRRWRTARLLVGLTIPVLMAAFRHGDELAIAMDARGFGALPTRTTHVAAPLRWWDGAVVAAVWAGTVVAAIQLG